MNQGLTTSYEYLLEGEFLRCCKKKYGNKNRKAQNIWV